MFNPRGRAATDDATLPARTAQAYQARVVSDLDISPARGQQAPPRSLRVAHFTDTYEPRRDGIITSVQALVSAMSEAGHDGRLVVPGHRDQLAADHLLQLRSVPCGVAQFRLAAWPRECHVEQVAAWDPDIIHVHTPGPVGLLGVLAARRLDLPLVQTYHTDVHAYADAYRVPSRVLAGVIRCYARRLGVANPPIPKQLSRDARRRALLDAANYLLLGSADVVLVPTPAVLSRHGLPVRSERLFIAPSGVTLPPIPAGARAEFRARYDLGTHDPVVLFVGRVNREKGVDLLIDAFGRLGAELPRARLVLVGAVYDQRWVKSLLHQAGIVDRTVTTGELPPAEVGCAYAAADVFAFPSQTDTQGLVLQEASLVGLPSVLVDSALYGAGPLAGVGVLAEPEPRRFGHAIAELLTDPVRRAHLGQAAMRRAERNTPERYAERVATLYAHALSS